MGGRRLFVGLAGALLVATTAVGASPAGAASAWTEDSVPTVTRPHLSALAVSCVNVYMCMSVGAAITPDGRRAAVSQRWNGTAWTAKPVPTPPTVNSILDDVSCPTASYCLAVGRYSAPGTGIYTLGATFAVKWNGTAWLAAPAPGIQVTSLSCASTIRCMALASHPLGTPVTSQLWNGSTWTTKPLAAPVPESLSGLSCKGSLCFAVGWGPNVQRWTGSAWTLATVPQQPGSAGLSTVSCASAYACMAIGTSFDFSTQKSYGVAVFWNGSKWVNKPAPAPQTGVLSALSCTAANACTAAGYSPGTLDHAAVVRWNGTAWTPATTPLASLPTGNVLTDVGCVSATACIAVGAANVQFPHPPADLDVPISLRLSGSTWTAPIMPASHAALSSALADVSCPSTTTCVAIGTGDNPDAAQAAIASVWNGTSWSTTSIHTLAAPQTSAPVMSAISCATTTSCVAVGRNYHYDTASFGPVAVSWNGTAWIALQVPGGGLLDDVSCATPTFCKAVGYQNIRLDSGGEAVAALVATWNGTAWTSEVLPLPYATYRQQLSAVTCLSTTACIAMGSTDTNGVNAPLAEAWTGTTWQVAPVPMPTVTATWAGFTDGYCSNQGCVAVGNYYQSNSNDPHPFADHWVPGGWTARPLPLPMGAASGTASAITCRSITLCTALVSIATGSVILAWNGSTWAIDATPTSTGATGQWLSGVSCLSSTSCVAVGSIGRYVSVPWVVRKG